MTIQLKAVVLFVILHKVVLTFESVDEIIKCDNSNESYRAVFSYDVLRSAVQVRQGNVLRWWSRCF